MWSWWRDGSVHRASWPSEDELLVDDTDGALLYAHARELTASIRHQRSTTGLGFNTRVRIADLTLEKGSWEVEWPSIRSDIFEGNNVEEAEVRFARDGSLDMKLVPVAPDA